MNRIWSIALCLLATSLAAQVQVDVPIQFSGADGQRGIDGLAPPSSNTAAITVGFSMSGAAHWCTAVLNTDTLDLSISPAPSDISDGLLLRFLAPVELHPPVVIRLSGLPPYPLLRADGLPLSTDAIPAGAVCEVVFSNAGFTLLSPAPRGCRPGAVRVHQRLCMDAEEGPLLNFHQAAAHCAAKGGKLCRRDEYYAACTLVPAQLSGMFDNWEWVDDTSNHTQTADQAGFNTCDAQRSAIPLNPVGTRCCYQPR